MELHTSSFCTCLSAILTGLRRHAQVAFAKLKIPVTDRQLERVAEALFKDIKAARDTTEQQLSGINEEEALQEAKMARCGSSMISFALSSAESQRSTQAARETCTEAQMGGISKADALQTTRVARVVQR